MAGVEQEHGIDFSGGIPAAYPLLGALLDTIIAGVEPDFAVVKLEGDAVFAAAPAADLDGHGDRVLQKLGAMYGRSSIVARGPSPRATTFARPAQPSHVWTSRSCSTEDRRCARWTGQVATSSARP